MNQVFLKLKSFVSNTIISQNYEYSIIILAAFLHFLFMCLFYVLQIKEMFIINIFSTLIYIFLAFFFRTKYTLIACIIAYLEIFLHQVAGIYFTGSNAGFDLLLSCLILIQFAFFNKTVCFISTIFIIFSIYTGYYLDNLGYLSDNFYINPIYANAKVILYPINVFILITFILAYGLLATAIPSKKINELKELALRDFLTGLYNRKYIEENILPKHKNEHLLIAIFDIDNFKHINDTYGHNIGDLVLKTLSLLLISKAKKYGDSDVKVSRWGGEEFLLIANCDKHLDVFALLEEIREEISTYEIASIKEHITISVGGYAAFYTNKNDYSKFLEAADENLYKAKKEGKNKTVLTNNI